MKKEGDALAGRSNQRKRKFVGYRLVNDTNVLIEGKKTILKNRLNSSYTGKK